MIARRGAAAGGAARLDPAGWFAQRAWQAFDFQREVRAAMAAGESGLLHASTGSGKTYAVWFGALMRAAALGVLWLTPMKALAADTTRAIELPLPELAPAWTVGRRTGDAPSAERARQDKRLPTALVTTPESLSSLLTREHAARELGGVHTVIVDEWHELIGNKCGVQVQLALARLRCWNPQLAVWGLSATLGNLDEAMATVCGAASARLVQGRIDKTLVIDTLLPKEPGRFSWGGHLGAQMQQPVVEEIERTMKEGSGSTLVFSNVRSQAEIWYQLLLAARPEWAGQIALHHGSLDKDVRTWVEAGLKDGSLRAVAATSSLDLGVDFLPVERVLQIGSAKGVARLLQRAGRSGHAPGRASRVTLVPTDTLELIEADALFADVKTAFAHRALTRDEFDWALDSSSAVAQAWAPTRELHRAPGTWRLRRARSRRFVDRETSRQVGKNPRRCRGGVERAGASEPAQIKIGLNIMARWPQLFRNFDAARLAIRLLALWKLFKHPDTPLVPKLVAVAVLAYAVSPIDLIPDFIPVLGLLDDIILLPLGVALVARLTPTHLWRARLAEAEAGADNLPCLLWGAVAVVLVWLLLLGGFGWWRWSLWNSAGSVA